MSTPFPLNIKLLQKQRLVEILFNTGEKFSLPCDYLRANSPSAEVKAQKLQAVQVNKNVNIIDIEPVGNYAVKFIFDDGHQTGIYSWEVLYALSIQYMSTDSILS